jgi:hypothetical protein
MEKINWTKCVRNGDFYIESREERKILHKIKGRKEG